MTGARRILIVDDEDDIRELGRISLERVGGHEVLTASSGEEALALADSEQPDAILLDAMMPGLDGPSTLRRLREQESTVAIPVAFLTARSHPADRAELEEMGARGVLSKPFDPMELPAQVAAVLGWD